MAKSRDEYVREHDNDGSGSVSFDMVDERTVERLRRNGDIELPGRRVDVPRDEAWNTRQLASRLIRGIENGDSIQDISNSLVDVIGNDENATMRTARTMFTGAENAGRVDSYRELADRGVELTKVWMSTPDSRTREEHLMMDGEEVQVDEQFSNGCEYPGDPAGDPATVYNCRCSLRSHIVGFRRASGGVSYVDGDRGRTLHNEQMEGEMARRSDAYATASNRAEAISIMRNDLHFNTIAGRTSLIDDDLLVENVNRLSELNNRFNAIPTDGIRFSVNDSESIADVGYVETRNNSRTTSLNVSSRYFGSPSFRDNQMIYSEMGWNMPLSADYSGTYTITHEYGHIVQNNLTFTDEYRSAISRIPRDQREEFASQMVSSIRSEQREQIISIAMERNPNFDLMENISEYGRASDAEFFAEAFANSFCGKPNELGLAMSEWLRRQGL